MIQVQISEQKINYFKVICNIDIPSFVKIRTAFSEEAENLLSISEFTATLRSTPLRHEQAVALSSTLISLRRLKDRYQCTTRDIVDHISQTFAQRGWTEDEIARWNERAPHIVALVESDLTSITENASDLYWRHINYCQDFKVITECRPVFTNSTEKVVGYVTLNNLYLVFSRGARRESTLAVALGLEQMRGLARELDKAIKQTEAYQEICDREKMLNRVFDSKW